MSKERAIFAGGCFWCMVQPFEEQTGILAVTSGYTGGMWIIQLMSKFVTIRQDILRQWKLSLITKRFLMIT